MNDFIQRILQKESPGGEPVDLRVTVPTVVRPGEDFALNLSVADDQGYPASACDWRLQIEGKFARPTVRRLSFTHGRLPILRVYGYSIAIEGLYRFRVVAAFDGRKRIFWSNPICCTQEGTRIRWGDPHVHTVLSDCHPDRCLSLNFCYAAARWFTGLDWVAAADHVSNGRCTPGKWREQAAVSELFDAPPEFVTLPAYEASFKGGAGGDNNVYMRRWPDRFIEDYENGTIATVCHELSQILKPGAEFFVVPHHTTRTGKHGEIAADIYPGEELMPVLEIYSKWGAGEYRGNPDPLHKVHEGPAYAVDLLGRGFRLGFIAGTDSHATVPAGFGNDHLDRLPGLTAVFAENLTRESVFDAIRTRNTYAASLERIYLDVRLLGTSPGASISWPEPAAPRKIEVVAAARTDIETIELVRNGRTVESLAPGNWWARHIFSDAEDLSAACLTAPALERFAYYYIRVTCTSGARAWSSPVWLIL